MFKVLNKSSLKSFKTAGKNCVLEDGLNSGIKLPYGCKKGLCGKCKTTILKGEVIYKGDLPVAITKNEVQQNIALLCQCRAISDLVINVEELDELTDNSIVCKVENINHLNHDVVQIILKMAKSNSLEYLAGQYIDIKHSDFKPRSFSIANAATNSGLIELHIRLVKNGVFTNFLLHTLKEKSILRIEGPKGNFYLRDNSASPIIFVAGGTGFGPIKALIEDIIIKKIPRKIYLYWGVRDERDIYSDIPKKWAENFDNINYIPVLSEANSSWKGAKGFVHQQVATDFNNLSAYEVYTCGPPIMIESATNAFLELGLKKENFFSDSFEYAFMNNN